MMMAERLVRSVPHLHPPALLTDSESEGCGENPIAWVREFDQGVLRSKIQL